MTRLVGETLRNLYHGLVTEGPSQHAEMFCQVVSCRFFLEWIWSLVTGQLQHSIELTTLTIEPPFRYGPRCRGISQFYLHTHRTRLSKNRMNLPSRNWTSFIDSGGMEGWVGQGTTTVQFCILQLQRHLNCPSSAKLFFTSQRDVEIIAQRQKLATKYGQVACITDVNVRMFLSSKRVYVLGNIVCVVLLRPMFRHVDVSLH